MADAPAGQAARPAGNVVTEVGQAGEQGGVRRRAAVDQVRGRLAAARAHEGGMVDCPSSMSAMTARMNSSASSVMPPATPP